MDLSLLPSTIQLPAGYTLPGAGSAASGANSGAASSGPTDIVSVSGAINAGTFNTVSGDTYRLSDLFAGSAPGGGSISGYRLALGAGSGQLLLNNVDVSSRTSFTAAEFAQLTYTAGADQSQQSLVVAAQTSQKLPNSTATEVTDSKAVQITANVNGTRSINAMSALTATPNDGDANVVSLVKEASILTGTGSGQPKLSTEGNFTTAAGDVYRLSDLFAGSAPAGGSISGYRLALGAGSGQLLLNNVDVSSRTSFTAAEFSQLTYTAGADQSQQSLVVAAQTSQKLPNSTATEVTDSQPVQITASVTGIRSINAMNALTTTPTDSDANVVGLVKEASILTGTGSGQPTLSTDGNFTAAAGDVYRLSDLFAGSAPAGRSISGYRLALGAGSGQLLLNNVDVSSRTSFTAAEFSQLTYAAGADQSQQPLVVAAQTSQKLPNSIATEVTESQAVQITANITGTRSINAMNALIATPDDSDANVVSLVKEAGILTGTGSGQPTLSTEGNFTTAAGDVYRLSDLFEGSAPGGGSISGYRLALGAGSGQLLLNNVDVSSRTSFTAAEFAQLTYTAGADQSQQSLVVAAQTSQKLPNSTATEVTDSKAVQITANVNGTRSINAMSALTATPNDGDANVVSLVKEASILTGTGSGQPKLSTEGNFTAAAGDVYRLSDLFAGSAPAGGSISGYRLALGAGSGQLLLNNVDVSSRTSFTAAEFAQLTYTAGADQSQQSLVVAAQTSQKLPNSTATEVTDSKAVQITANVTGTRSINTMSALTTTPTDSDANVVRLVKEASILTGTGSGQPVLKTHVTPQPSAPPATLGAGIGDYNSAGSNGSVPAVDLSLYYRNSTGNFLSTNNFVSPTSTLSAALMLLSGDETGGFRSNGTLNYQSQAIAAYTVARGLIGG